jgi:hypothetical protein
MEIAKSQDNLLVKGVQVMENEKKYRIISIEAEKLIHSQLTGGFSTQIDGKMNTRLFSGILDYSLESEKLYEVWEGTRKMSRKTYFSKNGYDYTTAVINVKFQYTRHNFVSINGIYVREGYKVSENLFNSAELCIENGEEKLIALKTYQPLEYIITTINSTERIVTETITADIPIETTNRHFRNF